MAASFLIGAGTVLVIARVACLSGASMASNYLSSNWMWKELGQIKLHRPCRRLVLSA